MEKKYVENYFTMSKESTLYIQSLTPKFKLGVFGELIYYRTYSRQKENGEQETWNDTIIRVTNGIMSIRKDWYIKNVLEWDDTYWQKYALKFAEKMFCMKFSGAGRSLWALGTDQVYVRGSAALFNCGAVTTKNLLQSTNWTMDMLMNGVGIGFDTAFDGTDNKYIIPDKNIYEIYQIPDTRQGWVDSVSRLIKTFWWYSIRI
jgi:ribonucleoside-diphosphate reductase alpha chain